MSPAVRPGAGQGVHLNGYTQALGAVQGQRQHGKQNPGGAVQGQRQHGNPTGGRGDTEGRPLQGSAHGHTPTLGLPARLRPPHQPLTYEDPDEDVLDQLRSQHDRVPDPGPQVPLAQHPHLEPKSGAATAATAAAAGPPSTPAPPRAATARAAAHAVGQGMAKHMQCTLRVGVGVTKHPEGSSIRGSGTGGIAWAKLHLSLLAPVHVNVDPLLFCILLCGMPTCTSCVPGSGLEAHGRGEREGKVWGGESVFSW